MKDATPVTGRARVNRVQAFEVGIDFADGKRRHMQIELPYPADSSASAIEMALGLLTGDERRQVSEVWAEPEEATH